MDAPEGFGSPDSFETPEPAKVPHPSLGGASTPLTWEDTAGTSQKRQQGLLQDLPLTRLLTARLTARDKFGHNLIKYALGLMREKGPEAKGAARRCSSSCLGESRVMGFEGAQSRGVKQRL